VRRLSQSGGGVAVESDAGVWRARRAIVALAPTLAGRICYEPALPALRDQLTHRVPQRSVIKFEAAYETPFLARRRSQRSELQ
jgi:monoamine oxidase